MIELVSFVLIACPLLLGLTFVVLALKERREANAVLVKLRAVSGNRGERIAEYKR